MASLRRRPRTAALRRYVIPLLALGMSFGAPANACKATGVPPSGPARSRSTSSPPGSVEAAYRLCSADFTRKDEWLAVV